MSGVQRVAVVSGKLIAMRCARSARVQVPMVTPHLHSVAAADLDGDGHPDWSSTTWAESAFRQRTNRRSHPRVEALRVQIVPEDPRVPIR